MVGRQQVLRALTCAATSGVSKSDRTGLRDVWPFESRTELTDTTPPDAATPRDVASRHDMHAHGWLKADG